jgi:tripartite-type tricarboxylate transporter receptor subunit TctC
MFKRFLIAAVLILGSSAAMAQAWPTKPIRLIVPLAPGATADIIARIYADELGKALGQNIVVDNKTGAGGTIGTAEGARAPADGYTVMFITQGTMAFNPGLYAKPGYDPAKDFASVAVGGSVSNVLVVHPDNPAKTVADIATVLLERDAGIKLQHVPYRTTPAAIMGVANGEVAMGLFNPPTVISLIQSGKLKAIAITSEARSPLLPQTPTMIEQGMKGLVFNTWMGFAVPKAAPDAIIARLNAEVIRISQLPSVREKLGAQGIDMMPPESPAQVDKLVRDELALWVPIIKASGATAE